MITGKQTCECQHEATGSFALFPDLVMNLKKAVQAFLSVSVHLPPLPSPTHTPVVICCITLPDSACPL